LTDADGPNRALKIRTMRLPDTFQDHDNPDQQYDDAKLTAPHIVTTALTALRWNETAAVPEARVVKV
ncbi:MAG: hypothetical protein ABIQ81_04600, partial [Novosphingobium sp.]